MSIAPGKPTIVVSGVTHSFEAAGKIKVLADVSLSVADGEFLTLVGPSGCGKTTLLNMMAGLLTPTYGSLTVNGKTPICGSHDVAYMLARDALLPWRTVLGNAELGTEVRRAKPGRARELLEHVGLGQFVDAYPKALSQGMRQRAALARTFAIDADVLLMDEPFAALDAQTKLQLEDTLLDLWQGKRRTVVFVTHDLHEAVSVSDRVVVMSARPGRIHAVVDIDLPRPRQVRGLQASRQYHELYSTVWHRLEEGLT
ncbi:MAG: ABC transporter ATP-binding protein [Anaerolineae bacterium]